MQLFGFELRRAAVIGQAIVPPESFRGLAGQTDWHQTMRRQMEILPFQSKLLLRVSLAVVWFAPLFMGYFRFFGGLDAAARNACLERLMKARNYYIRQVLLFIKLTVCSCVLGNERMMREIQAYDFGHPVHLSLRAPS